MVPARPMSPWRGEGEMDRYVTLNGEGEGALRERASRFIGIAFPIASETAFKDRLALIARAHHSSRHLCYGWVLGEDGSNTRANDAGEPAGTAGRPILRRIQLMDLTFTAVVVVRYFGGTLLGKPGLVSAYGGAAQLALEQAPRVQRITRTTVVVRCTYAQVETVRKDLHQHDGELLDSVFTDACVFTIALPRDSVQAMVGHWKESGIEATRIDQGM